MRGSGGITGLRQSRSFRGAIGIVKVAENPYDEQEDQKRCHCQECQRHHDELNADFGVLVAGAVRAGMYRVFHCQCPCPCVVTSKEYVSRGSRDASSGRDFRFQTK